MANIHQVTDDIRWEVTRQEELRDEGRFAHVPYEVDMTDDVFLRILVEEVGEIARAIHEDEGDRHLYKEITQVAAICASRMLGMRAWGDV